MAGNNSPRARGDLIKLYVNELDFLVEILLLIADKEYQVKAWYLLEEPGGFDWFDDGCDALDYKIDYFKHLVRKKEIMLGPQKIKAILRVHVMSETFSRIVRKDPDAPADGGALQLYVIEHPYWEKIRKQAQHALSLLKK